MVKLPSLDELKKMGSGLIDQAKAVNFKEMADKVKSGIESVSGKKGPSSFDDVVLKDLFQELFTTINELTQAQATQLNAVKKIEKQLEQLAKVVEHYQPGAQAPTQDNTNTEENKTNEK